MNKKLFFSLLIASSLGASNLSSLTLPTLNKTTHNANTVAFKEEFENYQKFTERLFSIRANGVKLFTDIKDREYLRGSDLDRLHHLIANYLSIRDTQNDIINRYLYLVDDSDGYSSIERLKRVMISLSAMLVRYDDYVINYSNYENSNKLREIFNCEDSGYGIGKDTLDDITNTYNSYFQRDKLKKMINFYKDNIDSFKDIKDDDFLYLKLLIEQSLYYNSLYNDSKAYLKSNLSSTLHKANGKGVLALGASTNELSKIFGNSVGLVETRKGKLYNKKEVIDRVKSKIKAGDILIEKTPFRLTDKLIPGYWGHAAVYIGTPDELKELGIWDNPIVKKFHKEITDGKLIDEALRDGVQLNSIEHFMNIDDLAILRDNQETPQDKAYRIILALRQLNKEYDFNFDIQKSDKIVCSELIYVTSTKIDWEVEKTAGRYTISPDHVAKKSIDEEKRLDIILLYHDGKEVKNNKQETMKKLLDEN